MRTVFTTELRGRTVNVATRNVPGGDRRWRITPDAPCLVYVGPTIIPPELRFWGAHLALFRAGKTYLVPGLADPGVATVAYLEGNAPNLTIVDVTDEVAGGST